MYEGGKAVKDACREYGISDATFYNWRTRYGGLEVSQVKRLKEWEEENRQLKHMYAELSLDHRIIKDIVEKSSKAGGEAHLGRLRKNRTPSECPARVPNHGFEPHQLRVSTRYHKGRSGYCSAPEAGRRSSPMGIPLDV